MDLEKWIEFSPAWDKRHTDPGKNYGIHGVEMTWFVRGPEGAVQFKVFTNWHLPHVMRETDAKIQSNSVNRFALKFAYHPIPADIGYHSYVPHYEGQTMMSENCHVLHGKPCYYDGSTLDAEPVFDLLVAEGGDAVWARLEQYYRRTFLNGANA